MNENLKRLSFLIRKNLEEHGINNLLDQKKFIENKSFKRLQTLREEFKEGRLTKLDVELGFVLSDFREYILTGYKFQTTTDKKEINSSDFKFARNEQLVNFLKNNLVRGPQIRFKDIYALVIGYNGYNDFCIKEFSELYEKNGHDKIQEFQVSNQNLSSNNILEDPFIKVFFNQKCLLYAYSEAIAEPDENTEYKDINFPTIDTLIMYLEEVNNTFKITNIDEKENHSQGIISWAGENNRMAFDINFPRKDRSLLLRFHIPISHQEISKINLLIGTFSFVHFTGIIVSGTVVLEKAKKNTIVEPYKFKFSYSDEYENEPPNEIQKFLFDRYLNWFKMKGGIYDRRTLKNWLNKREKKQYIRNIKREYKYLITYPVTSLDGQMQSEVTESFEKILDNFKENYKISKKLERSVRQNNYKGHGSLENLVDKIHENLDRDNDLIELFPLTKDNIGSENKQDLNKSIFESIGKSVSVVIVIPNGTYLKKSSVYTIAGYSIALRKKTFILHQNHEDLPLIIQEDIKSMGLYVYEYENIEEIPFMFFLKNKKNSKFKLD